MRTLIALMAMLPALALAGEDGGFDHDHAALKAFLGSAVADGGVDYEDGTPATATQMAKDVCVFLAWAAEPEADERKLMGFKVMTALTVLSGFMWWYKRKVWSTVKHRRLGLY